MDSDADASSDLAGHVTARVESQDGHEECTLFPADAPADELVTTWVTAADDAFVALADCR
ncbi:MAG: hypothetical protein ABEJ88_00220 [Halobacterium sp.]